MRIAAGKGGAAARGNDDTAVAHGRFGERVEGFICVRVAAGAERTALLRSDGIVVACRGLARPTEGFTGV